MDMGGLFITIFVVFTYLPVVKVIGNSGSDSELFI